MNRVPHHILRFVTVVLVLLALATLFPNSAGTEVNGIGYRSYCPFAPTSTLMLAGVAVAVWQWRLSLDR